MICGGSFDLEVKQTEIAEREQLSEQQGFGMMRVKPKK